MAGFPAYRLSRLKARAESLVIQRLCTVCGADYLDEHEDFCEVPELLAQIEELEAICGETES